MHIKPVTRIVCLLLALCTVFGLTACGKGDMLQSQIYAMRTPITITAYGNNAQRGIKSAESIISSLNIAVDPTNESSIVYAINNANGQSTVVTSQIARGIETAQRIYKRTDGALDLTVYPLLQLWGFSNGKYYVPNAGEIMLGVEKTCFNQVNLVSYPTSGSYTVTAPYYCSMTLAAVDRGLASAYGIDALSNMGVESGVISMSGSIQTLGLKPDGSLWTVAIQDPVNPDSYVGTVSVGQTAIETTAGYTNTFTDITTDKEYSHIIRPSSGYTVSNSILSVTIISEDAVLADALATALYVLGSTQAINYWRSYGKSEGEEFEMILILEGGDIVCTSGLLEQFTLVNTNYKLRFTE